MAIDVEQQYATYGPMVLRRCRRLLRQEHEAVDAMHDTFVQLLRHQSSLDDSAPSSLLFRIATNVCLNKLRTRGRRPAAAPDLAQNDDLNLSHDFEQSDLLDRIVAADHLERRSHARGLLQRLFASEQESTLTIAVFHLVDDMTLEEVAHEVGLSVSGVRKRLRQLRRHLIELEAV